MHNRFLLTCLLVCLFGFQGLAQSVDELVNSGVALHDQGQYQQAIEKYKLAHDKDANSPAVNYRMAQSYMGLEDYKSAIKYSTKVIELKKDFQKEAHIINAAALGRSGNMDESVKMFEKAVKKFGESYELYYTYGEVAKAAKRYDIAEMAFGKAIQLRPSDPNTHYVLGMMMDEGHRRIPSILSLHYFLMLEPESARAKEAYKTLINQMGSSSGVSISKSGATGNNITINVGSGGIDSEFGAAEFLLAMGNENFLSELLEGIAEEATDSTATATTDSTVVAADSATVAADTAKVIKNEREKFADKTTSLFKMLGDMKTKTKGSVYWEFYIPFYKELAASDHMDAYAARIRQAGDEESATWLKDNTEDVSKLNAWLKEQGKM